MIFVNFVNIAFIQKDMPKGLEYLGSNFVKVTENLQNESLKLIESKTTIPEEQTKVQGIWEFLKNIYGIFSALFIIYVWLWILAKILLAFPISDSSKQFTAWIIAIIIFLLLQMVITKSFATPLQAFGDFGRAMVSLFKPATEKAIKSINDYTNISNTTNFS